MHYREQFVCEQAYLEVGGIASEVAAGQQAGIEVPFQVADDVLRAFGSHVIPVHNLGVGHVQAVGGNRTIHILAFPGAIQALATLALATLVLGLDLYFLALDDELERHLAVRHDVGLACYPLVIRDATIGLDQRLPLLRLHRMHHLFGAGVHDRLDLKRHVFHLAVFDDIALVAGGIDANAGEPTAVRRRLLTHLVETEILSRCGRVAVAELITNHLPSLVYGADHRGVAGATLTGGCG